MLLELSAVEPNLPYISPISPLHSPLYLAYISRHVLRELSAAELSDPATAEVCLTLALTLTLTLIATLPLCSTYAHPHSYPHTHPHPNQLCRMRGFTYEEAEVREMMARVRDKVSSRAKLALPHARLHVRRGRGARDELARVRVRIRLGLGLGLASSAA